MIIDKVQQIVITSDFFFASMFSQALWRLEKNAVKTKRHSSAGISIETLFSPYAMWAAERMAKTENIFIKREKLINLFD